MKRLSWVWLPLLGTSFLALLGSEAIAQPNASNNQAPAATQGSTLASAPLPAVAASALPSNGTAAAPAAVPEPGSCRLGEHAGINEDDARTAASIVCRELPDEARSSSLSYRVDLDKLGTATFITLTSESKGQSSDSRRTKLAAIEDVPTAAPHLVDALIHQKTMSQTEIVGNLTSADAAAPVRRAGKFQVGLGVLGAFAPGTTAVSAGAQLAVRYDTPRLVVTSQFRFAVGGGGDKKFNMVQFGVGPRYMLSPSDTSLFVGGGMAAQYLSKITDVSPADSAGSYPSSDHKFAGNGGAGVYGEVGVEMMRLHKNRLEVALRTDLPLFSVGGDYLVPISLTTSFIFD